MIELLARKEFLRISLDALKQNFKLLEQLLARYHSLDPVDIISASKRAYKLLPDKSFFTNQHEYELWQTVENLEALTDDPGYVRNHLVRRGRYERNGISEWNNIRYIYSKDDSLNAAEVKHILMDWVVPKL